MITTEQKVLARKFITSIGFEYSVADSYVLETNEHTYYISINYKQIEFCSGQNTSIDYYSYDIFVSKLSEIFKKELRSYKIKKLLNG